MNTTTNKTMVEPYLFFGGRCEEALAFYQEALGAKVDALMRFKDSPEPAGCGGPPVPGEKIMHANLRIGDTTIMASDGCCDAKQTFQGFALSLAVATEAEADQRFNALARGGQVQMPMDKTFFARRFGMVTDRFGVCWMVIVPAEEPIPQAKQTTARRPETVTA